MNTTNDVANQLNNPEFVAWITKPSQVEKYQAITLEKFHEFYTQAKDHARKIAQAIGLNVESIDTDTPEVRLTEMMKDGEVIKLSGLYWRHEALDDAVTEFYGLDSDSEQKDEEEESGF